MLSFLFNLMAFILMVIGLPFAFIGFWFEIGRYTVIKAFETLNEKDKYRPM